MMSSENILGKNSYKLLQISSANGKPEDFQINPFQHSQSAADNFENIEAKIWKISLNETITFE